LEGRLNVIDLHLLYTYLASTAKTFYTSSNPETHNGFWSTDIMPIAFEHHYVLQLLLSFSAFHLAYTTPNRRDYWSQVADKHLDRGLRVAAEQLQNLSKDNCEALYLATVLVCFTTFARGPRPGEFPMVQENSPDPMMLLKGVRSIIESMGPDLIFSGPLEKLVPRKRIAEAWNGRDEDLSPQRVYWQEPCRRLRHFITSTCSEEDSAIYTAALDNIEPCFSLVYADDTAISDAAEYSVVFVWMYRLEQNFMDRLREKKPIPLVLLSYFALLMSTLSKYWFMRDWPQHMMVGIKEHLSPEYQKWLEWPIKEAGFNI
jgi:hypothetical protein